MPLRGLQSRCQVEIDMLEILWEISVKDKRRDREINEERLPTTVPSDNCQSRDGRNNWIDKAFT